MHHEMFEPNLHAAMIHVPLGLLVVGTLIELAAPIFWRRSVFRAAGRWMILLGALSLLPVAAAGAYAVVDVNHGGDATWAEVRAASPIQGAAWEHMKLHMLLTLCGSGAVLLLVVLWLAASDRTRSALHFVFLIVLRGGVGTLAMGGRRGGEMVYRYHVGMSEADSPADEKQTGWRIVENYVPPEELHVVLAGGAMAAGLAAIGLSMRRKVVVSAMTAPPPAELTDIGYVFNPAARPPANQAAQLSGLDDAGVRTVARRQPVARFWVLALLLAIAAALAGYWTMAAGSDTWNVRDLYQTIHQNAVGQDYRLNAHLVAGVGIVVLMLLMAAFDRAGGGQARFARCFLAAIACGDGGAGVGGNLIADGLAGRSVSF